MLDFYPLHLPEDKTPGHCLATFSTALTALAIELGTYFDNQMRVREGADWFNNLKEDRLYVDSKYHQYKTIFDISWIVNEPFHFTDSPIRDLLPKNEYNFYPSLKLLLEHRNRWYHDFNPHNIMELRKSLQVIKYVADKCGLELSDDLTPVIARVNEIANDTYISKVEKPQVKEKTQEQIAQPLRQAAVGAAWIGPIGSRKIQLTKSGSLIDVQDSKNVTKELDDTKNNRYLQLWKLMEIDWMWVDTLGSVAAYVHGSLRMVGYWGSAEDEGSQDPFAKFLLTHSYAFENGQLFDRENLKKLDLSAIGPVSKSTIKRGMESVQAGEILRLTWDGDLIHFGDQGPEYIGEIESKDWFHSHFFMETA